MKITLLISIFVLSIVGVLFTSCDDKLEVLQAYDFSVSTMPVQKRIKQGETAEIRLQLNKSGNYKETEFRIGYFQFDGVGILRMDDGTTFLPNDTYPLKKETFRLYYTSQCTDQQALTLYVYDSFGQCYELEFSWQNDSDKEGETEKIP